MPLLPTIQRSRLIAQLTDPLPKLVKFIAPAGYGKTTISRSLVSAQQPLAVLDAANVHSTLSFYRELVQAAATTMDEAGRARIVGDVLVFASDEIGWEAFAIDVLQQVPAKTVLLLENAEEFAERKAVIAAFERLVRTMRDDTHLIICSRINVPFRLGRFAGPDRTRIVSAKDLAFDPAEIADVFSGMALTKQTLADIGSFTRGWPIVVMMLFALARRGRLAAYLGDDLDVADLYGYLASEVYESLDALQQRVLEALAAVPDASESDLTALFSGGDYVEALQMLQRDTPFITRRGDVIDVHPAMRQMLAQRRERDRLLERLYHAVDRSDGGIRAAEIAMHRGRPEDAVTALAHHTLPYGSWAPPPRFTTVLSSIPPELLIATPNLWTMSAYDRASWDVVTVGAEAELLVNRLGSETPPQTRISVMALAAQLFINRGRFPEAEGVAKRLATDPDFSGIPIASLMSRFWTYAIEAYRGDPIDLSRLDDEFAPIMASPEIRTAAEGAIVAAYHRMHGNHTEDNASLERGIEIGTSTGLPMMIIYGYFYGAMGAWFWNDEQRFRRCLAGLEAAATPALEHSYRHFLECVAGRGATAPTATEKLDMRVYAYAIAAGVAKTRAERSEMAHATLIAAEHSGQRFCEVIARVILSFADPEDALVHLARAARLAEEIESPELIRAIAALTAGDASGTMLAPLAARFSLAPGAKASTNGSRSSDASEMASLRISLLTGDVFYHDVPVLLSRRELQLLVFLAIRDGQATSDQIARALWPSSNSDAARSAFRVTVKRLRDRIGTPDVVVSTANGYRLGVRAILDVVELAARIEELSVSERQSLLSRLETELPPSLRSAPFRADVAATIAILRSALTVTGVHTST